MPIDWHALCLRIRNGVVTVLPNMKYLGSPQSGSRADIVASRNTFGQYYRERAVPINPATARQGNVRVRLTLLAQSWKNLTDNQRNAWKTGAASVARIDSLGQTYHPTGFGYFVSVNMLTDDLTSSSFLTDPPLAPAAIDLPDITPTWTAGALSVVFNVPASGNRLQVWAAKPQSTSQGFAVRYTLIKTLKSTDTSPVTLTANWVGKWGTGVPGQYSPFRTRIVYPDGSTSSWFYVSVVIA